MCCLILAVDFIYSDVSSQIDKLATYLRVVYAAINLSSPTEGVSIGRGISKTQFPDGERSGI